MSVSGSIGEWLLPMYRLDQDDRWLATDNELAVRYMVNKDEGQGVYNYVENSGIIWRV